MTALIILSGIPNATTASGRTSSAAMPMPVNQIVMTTSRPVSGSLRSMAVSVVIDVLEPVARSVETTDVLHQGAYRRVDPDPPGAWQGLNRQTEYRFAVRWSQLCVIVRYDDGDEDAV